MRSVIPWSAAVLLALASVLSPGCRAPGPARAAAPPVTPAASRALAEARLLLGRGAAPDDPALRAALDAARALAPDWVASERLADDLELRSLRAPGALSARRAELGADLGSDLDGEGGDPARLARAAYLAGRLDPGAGSGYFARAASLDPHLAWAHHGLAFAAAGIDDARAAVRHQRRALELARDPWERAFFAVALARYLVESDRAPAAAALLRAELGALDLEPHDRAWLAIETALVEVRQPDGPARAEGYERALTLLREADLERAALARLVGGVRVAGIEHDWRSVRLMLAVAARPGPDRERELARLLLTRGEQGTPLGLRLLEEPRARAAAVAGRALGQATGWGSGVGRLGWFSAGRYAEGIERWLEWLPGQVLDAEGMPRDPRLAEVVRRARRLGATRGADEPAALAALGEALLDAGWFDEARHVSDGLARFAAEPALDLTLRALAGAELIGAIERLAQDDDAEGRRAEGWALGVPAPAPEESATRDEHVEPVGDLETLLVRMAVLVAQANRFLGGSVDVPVLEQELLASPRLGYGRFAQVVHPGPWFSAEDEALGRGPAGEPVPGLARLMERLGRFATFGQVLGGGGPDGVVLRRLWVERRAGEHLGVPWSGTIAWCEGADLGSRAARVGAYISGAAVHEGYWIDVQVLRPEHERWRTIAAMFDGAADDPHARRRVERALASGGLPLESSPMDGARLERARVAVDPVLDQADRVRLAVLVERAPTGRLVGEMTFDELVQCVALHEEGHMVDRAMHMPLLGHPMRALRLLADAGFTVRGVQRLLEYRAQLVALCVAPDPRLALVDLLEIGGEGSDDMPLEHGRAYHALLRDLVRELERATRGEPARYPGIDRDRTLVHQLHRLDPESLRTLARRLAKRQGVGR